MSEIEKLLPHRKPFLFLDTVTIREGGKISGTYRFAPELAFFAGHFPAYPVVPGVILVETMAQCGGAALCKMGLQPPGSVFLLATVNEAKFRRPVRPGDEVRIEVENLRVSAKLVRQRGTCYVGDDVAAQAEWLCVAGVVS